MLGITEPYDFGSEYRYVPGTILINAGRLGDLGINTHRPSKIRSAISIPGKFLNPDISIIGIASARQGAGVIDDPVLCSIRRFKKTVVSGPVSTCCLGKDRCGSFTPV